MSKENPIIVNIDNPVHPRIIDSRIEPNESIQAKPVAEKNLLLMLIGIIIGFLLFSWLKTKRGPSPHQGFLTKNRH